MTNIADIPVELIDPSEGFLYWVSGFIDGEGCFTITYSKYKERTYWQPLFSLGLKGTDSQILAHIVEVLEIGVFYERIAQYCGGDYPVAYWRITAWNDLLRFCELLEQHPLRTSKGEQFVLWHQAVLEYQKPLSERDDKKMMAIRTKLSEMKRIKK